MTLDECISKFCLYAIKKHGYADEKGRAIYEYILLVAL